MNRLKPAAVAVATALLLSNAALAATQTWTVTATTTSAVAHDRGGVPAVVGLGATYYFSITGDDAAGFNYDETPVAFKFNEGPGDSARMTSYYNKGTAYLTLLIDHNNGFIDLLALDYAAGSAPANVAAGFAGLASAIGTTSPSSVYFHYGSSDITARIDAISPVPEPASYALLAGGLMVALAAARRRCA